MRLAIERHRLQQLFFFHHVDFIDDQDAGQIFLLHPLDQHLLGDADAGYGLYQQNGGVHLGYRLIHNFHHIIAQGVFGLVQAGGIQKDHLKVPLVAHAGDAVAGGLRLIAHNGHFDAAKGVGQGGFAHIGPAHHRKYAGFFDHVFSPVSRSRPICRMISSSRPRISLRSCSPRSWS